MNETLVAAALDYAARGWRVLPLHTPQRGGRCSCLSDGCTSPGKHPRTMRGVHDATTDEATIRRWWARWPAANVGIATGGGLVVLDVDPRHGGDASLAELEEAHDWVRTLTARTGSGGLHLYLAGDLPARAGMLPGLDLKASGGYVVAPPSLHACGRRYEWVAPEDLPTEPQPVPTWFAAMAAPPRPAWTPRAAGGLEWGPIGRRFVVSAIERECLAVAEAPEGTRNTRLNCAAYNLARFVAAGLADAGTVAEALTIAARAAGLPDREIERTIRSAFRAREVAA